MGAFLFRRGAYLGEIPYPVVRGTPEAWEVEGDWKGTPPADLAGAGDLEVEIRPRKVVPVEVERTLAGGRAVEVRGTHVLLRGGNEKTGGGGEPPPGGKGER